MKNIDEYLSKSRLSSFYVSNNDTKDLVLARYLWNVELSKELYLSLHFLEVVLRNTIHDSFKNHFQNEFWFNLPQFTDTKGSVQKATKEIKKNGVKTADDIVARLTLGFWCHLFNKDYDKIWHKTIKNTFPTLKNKKRSRAKLQPEIEAIRKLRNRVFHHEPIYNMKNLSVGYESIIEFIGGISPEVQQIVKEQCRFLSILSTGEQAFLPLAQKMLSP
ncbi:MAG: hypothetical protein R3E08_13835 [Thiotrichaceae bacterium]